MATLKYFKEDGTWHIVGLPSNNITLESLNGQVRLFGQPDQIVGFDENGNAKAIDVQEGVTSVNGQTGDVIIDGIDGEDGKDGENGVGIDEIVLTNGNHTPGTLDTYQVKFSNGNIFDYQIYNGKDGKDGTDGTNGADGLNGVQILTVNSTNEADFPAVVNGAILFAFNN